MKVAAFMSKSKAWNPFKKGKAGRDIASELYISYSYIKSISPKRGSVENSDLKLSIKYLFTIL